MQLVFDPELVERNRLRAARIGDRSAGFLLDIAAEELADRLSAVERHFAVGVELHGMTGMTAAQIMATGKVDRMIRVETNQEFGTENGPLTLAPLEQLPLAPESVNLIVSPLSAHLTNDTPGLFIQARRALKPDGLFLAAIPGAGTLAELREALLSAEEELTGGVSPRVIPFIDVRDTGALLQRAGFTLPVADVETYTVRYDSIFPLMRDLRHMGMANPLTGRSRTPPGRKLFVRAGEIYAERFSDPDGRIRATFSIVYVSGWAPHESQQKPLRPGSAKVSLAKILNDKSGPR
ncbi:methyltransferase domain-containing protein [Rhizobium sp. C1]|uniref:methyltransferase domain-containing protein n=1 Tax=Rhizobium sp. C1 TaxID=1349799 RepID=UPI001E4B7E2F|nr:methyltransferase domain-containing protein [Rhizobium sp. C1]MCD2179386.1 methyltransferase domain-containing protein [Rhizobium sp. C1]